MRTSSKGSFVLSIIWFVVSLLWFFLVKDIAIGVIWLSIAVIELVIAFVFKKKEQKQM